MRGNLFYDLAKATITRLAFGMAQELRPHGVASVAVSPGWMRTELVLAMHRADERIGGSGRSWPGPNRHVISAAPSPRWPPIRR
ncbi:hypothetical protein ACFQU2_26590 [Siccirubricoccus deserti]